MTLMSGSHRRLQGNSSCPNSGIALQAAGHSHPTEDVAVASSPDKIRYRGDAACRTVTPYQCQEDGRKGRMPVRLRVASNLSDMAGWGDE